MSTSKRINSGRSAERIKPLQFPSNYTRAGAKNILSRGECGKAFCDDVSSLQSLQRQPKLLLQGGEAVALKHAGLQAERMRRAVLQRSACGDHLSITFSITYFEWRMLEIKHTSLPIERLSEGHIPPVPARQRAQPQLRVQKVVTVVSPDESGGWRSTPQPHPNTRARTPHAYRCIACQRRKVFTESALASDPTRTDCCRRCPHWDWVLGRCQSG